mgnify:CR=1 FL=1
MSKKKKVALIILDGWGYGAKDESDAIFNAQTLCMDNLHASTPHATLRTDGNHVGLPEGQMGNSEVGHMNIGAGRIVYQDLLRINNAIAEGSFHQEKVILEALENAQGKRLHLMGLVSDGGVHSHQKHLYELISVANNAGIQNVFIHAFTDGRDTSPMMALEFLTNLESQIEGTNAKIATVHGRYFAMDRDNRMDRVAKSWNLLCKSRDQYSSEEFESAVLGIEASYTKGIGDEFIEPFRVREVNGEICNGDVVICFNFRTDRCRQITSALTQTDFPDHNMHTLDLHYVTMTNYDENFKGVEVIYDKPNLKKTLGEVISDAGMSQLRIAETEKYPHVTFFFNGGREVPFEGENRLMAHSPMVATYDLKPEMSAKKLVDLVIPEMESDRADFICLNFANPDMVGHTGVYDAIVQAVETTDKCLSIVMDAGLKNGYDFVVIADHGNADMAMNIDGSPHTAHTTNPVPILIISDRNVKVQDGILADIAPTILDLMGISKPDEMSGSSLIIP